MNFKARIFTMALALLPLSHLQAEPEQLDKVIAVVDQGVILQSELDDRIAQVSQRANAGNMALPDQEVLKQQVLDHLINEQLQLTMAQRVGLSINDQQVNQAITNIQRQNNISASQFEAQLQNEGVSLAYFKEQIRKDLTLQQIAQGMVQQRIHISPLEIDNFLNSADAQFWISPEYHLGHILISLPQSPSAEDVAKAKQKADAIVDKVKDGGVFAEFAIAESKGPAALKGGDLGWRKTSDLPTLFAEIVPKLKIGEVSEPARSAAGFHILKLYEKKGDSQQTEIQTRARHILLKPSAILSDEEAEKKLKKIRQQILDGADFAALAKEHSEDIGSMLAGGDLGWSKPGMFVPAFEQAIAETKEGEISEPFKSRFGWHILQVQERKQEDITDDVLREKAARILTSRRFEDEMQLWLREMRDAAYIDIKI